jgi:hypothetical protein
VSIIFRAPAAGSPLLPHKASPSCCTRSQRGNRSPCAACHCRLAPAVRACPRARRVPRRACSRTAQRSGDRSRLRHGSSSPAPANDSNRPRCRSPQARLQIRLSWPIANDRLPELGAALKRRAVRAAGVVTMRRQSGETGPFAEARGCPRARAFSCGSAPHLASPAHRTASRPVSISKSTMRGEHSVRWSTVSGASFLSGLM